MRVLIVLGPKAEVYASDDAEAEFTADFVAAWTTVTNLDRFGLPAAIRRGKQ